MYSYLIDTRVADSIGSILMETSLLQKDNIHIPRFKNNFMFLYLME